MNRYLYEQIYDELKAEILSGKYSAGDWFPPERALKERFGTTHVTVRNALAKLVLEGYIERYSGKGTVVLYSRHGAAPQQLPRFTWACLIVSDLGNVNAALLDALDAQMRKVPLALRVSCHHGDLLLRRALHRETVEAGALAILDRAGTSEGTPLLETPPRSTILLSREEPVAGCSVVTYDLVQAARLAARHFTGRGHTKVALLAPSEILPDFMSGLSEGLRARGLPPDALVPLPAATGVETATTIVEKAIHSEPSCRAILCASDEYAASALSAFRGDETVGGRTFSIVGFGDTGLARSLRITSIDPRPDLLAERVADAAREAIRGSTLAASPVMVPPELHARDT